MEPTLIRRGQFVVMGITARVKPEAADYDYLWHSQFAAREDEVKPRSTDDGYYGVYFPSDEPGVADFLAGMAVASAEEPPAGLVARVVPEAQYAVFEGTLRRITRLWAEIFGDWLPESGYEADVEAACFEYFPPGPCDPGSPVFIHLPILEGPTQAPPL